jgi:hypothetical protein
MLVKSNGKVLRTSILAAAGFALLSGSAMASHCPPGYIPVKIQGNTVCMLDAAAGNNTLVTPTNDPGPYSVAVPVKTPKRYRRLSK